MHISNATSQKPHIQIVGKLLVILSSMDLSVGVPKLRKSIPGSQTDRVFNKT
jgi:hypothetical protein